MTYMETLAGQVEWAARNTVYNLNFIPADKLDWKPAPSASSALEVVNHTIEVLQKVGATVSGNAAGQAEFTAVTNIEEAKSALLAATQDYCQVLRAVKPEDLNKPMEMPFGSFPLARLLSIPVIDLIHHHGQIAYIQTLLGDSESHFDMAAFG